VSSASKSGLSAAGRAYVALVATTGTGIVAWSLVRLGGGDVPLQWVVFAVLTIACNGLTVRVPSVDARLSVSEIFAFTCVLLFGPETAAVTFAIDALLLSLRLRYTVAQTFFNFGNLPLSIWSAGTLFFALSGLQPLFGQNTANGHVLLPLAAMTAAYFLLNSSLTAIAVALDARRPALPIWREHFLWLAPGYAAGSSIALLLVVAFRQVHLSAIALVPPLLFISYLTLRSSLGRLDDARRHVDKLNRMYLSTVETLATAIDAKDEVTHGHVRRVQAAAIGLARELGVSDAQTLQAIEAAALLHDTGKIAVPEHILNKPGRLTPAEFERMKLHAPIGAQILSSIDFPYPVVPIVRHHHESWDGSGYPDGIRGTDIPLGARILSVVDCFDALTSDRPYRRRMTDEEALNIIRERRGNMYDPLVVDTFVRCYQKIMPPADSTIHPAAQAMDEARKNASAPAAAGTPLPTADVPAMDEVLAFTSLSRAFCGEATLNDAGALLWMMIRQVVPCQAMVLFLPEDHTDAMAAAYAVGSDSATLRQLRVSKPQGVVGWVAVNRRSVPNAAAATDAGGAPLTVQWTLATPVVHDGALVAVLSLYSETMPFSEDQARLAELLAPRVGAAIAALNVRREQPRVAAFDRGGSRATRSATLRVLP
jgi:putative nucleotidyltransferase with HDIG domain